MINLMPIEEKAALRKDYNFRLASVYVLLFSIVVSIGLVLLLPSYLSIATQEKVATEELEALQNSSENVEREEINKELLATKEMLRELANTEERAELFTIVEAISRSAEGEIAIDLFSYSRASGEKHSSLVIGGVAATRDALLGFKRGLEEDERFEKVELPVSSLAADVNIKFNIDISGAF